MPTIEGKWNVYDYDSLSSYMHNNYSPAQWRELAAHYVRHGNNAPWSDVVNAYIRAAKKAGLALPSWAVSSVTTHSKAHQ